jgi:hypothetical protein
MLDEPEQKTVDTTALKKAMRQTNITLKFIKSKLELLFVPHNERYINLNLDSVPVKIDVIADMPRYCKVPLLGCLSPIKILCPIVKDTSQTEKIDVKIYLSTETSEPNINKNSKTAI